MQKFKAIWSQIQRSRTPSIVTQRESTSKESVERRRTKAETLEGWDHTTAEGPELSSAISGGHVFLKIILFLPHLHLPFLR